MPRKKRLTFFYYFLRITVVLLLAASILGIFIDADAADISRNVFVALQSIILLILSFGPSIVEKKFKLDIPDFMESIFLTFIIAALLLGEIAEFFVRFYWWDDLLHLTSGILVAITGVSIINFAVKKPNAIPSVSPLFIAVFIFCFSVSIEVIWEIFEYTVDSLFSFSNMLRTVDSITLVPYEGLAAVKDTIHDLIINVLGALTISITVYFDAKNGFRILNKWIVS